MTPPRIAKAGSSLHSNSVARGMPFSVCGAKRGRVRLNAPRFPVGTAGASAPAFF